MQPEFWHAPPHTGLGLPLPLYACPSDPRQAQTHLAPPPSLYSIPVALSGYLGVSGTDLSRRDGLFLADQPLRLLDITDGTSNTLLIGEGPAVSPYLFGWWYAGVGQFVPRRPGTPADNLRQRYAFEGTFTGSASAALGAAERNMQTSGNAACDGCPAGPYGFGPGSSDNPCDAFHFWSLHPGGANFAFADGSVQFLSYNVGSNLAVLATRNGGEVYNDWEG